MHISSTTQTNLFYHEPERTSIVSAVIGIRHHHFGTAVALAENIARAAGGGEPRDVGTIGGLAIEDIEKYAGKTWIAFASEPNAFQVGDLLPVALDAAHRGRRRRLHTAVHILIRSACEEIGSIEVVAAAIASDASEARVVVDPQRALVRSEIGAIDCRMRSEVLRDRGIMAYNAKSVEAARAEYGPLFRVSGRHALAGKVRLVAIEGLDVNPCSGLHHETSNIGPYALDTFEAVDAAFPTRLSLTVRLLPSWMYWYGDRY